MNFLHVGFLDFDFSEECISTSLAKSFGELIYWYILSM